MTRYALRSKGEPYSQYKQLSAEICMRKTHESGNDETNGEAADTDKNVADTVGSDSLDVEYVFHSEAYVANGGFKCLERLKSLEALILDKLNIEDVTLMSRSDVSRLLGSDHILHWNRITCDMQQSMDISIKHFATKMISKSCRMLVAKVTGGPQFSPFRSMQHKVAMSPRANLGFTEIEIKVPWGTLAGKLWNPNDTTPIIALHGWQDNAGSFDKLVPLLPEDISVLAIDLPGHGLSSWIPDGMMYTKLMYIQIIDRIRDHFRWERIGLLGHSYGAMFAFTYSGLFPNSVKFVIAIDYYKYLVENIGVRTARTARDFRDFIKIEKTKRPPFGYTEREMIEKMIKGSDDSLDESSCRVMMERGVTMKNNVCYLNRDPRVKLRDLSATFTEDLLREKARLVRCPYMVLKAEKTGYGEQKSSYFEILKAMEKSCEDLQFLTVPGKHHIHMTNAKRVAEVITPFIEKYN